LEASATYSAKKNCLTGSQCLVWALHSKIEVDPGDPKYILTERGFGYRFEIETCPVAQEITCFQVFAAPSDRSLNDVGRFSI